MTTFILRRLLGVIPVLWVVATLTFFLIRMAPGGPFDAERNIPPEVMKNIEAKYHMDEPMFMQYGRFLLQLAKGDLGPSFRYANRSVNEIIGETFPVSATIGLIGLLYALGIGVTLGLIAASKPNGMRDYISMLISMVGICLPSFVIGPLFVLVFATAPEEPLNILGFAIELDWFDVSGWDEPKDLVLPSLTLGTMYAAFFARLTRGGVIEIMRQDFIRTAYAKGLPGYLVIVKHALKGGLLPTVSFLGPAAAAMLTGSLVVETIFGIPGLGRFFVQSALNRDYTLVMGCVLFVAFLIIIMNLLVDIAYAFLDPRISYD